MREYTFIYINHRLTESVLMLEASDLKEAVRMFDVYTKGNYIDIIDIID